MRTILLPSSWAVSGLLHGGAAALLFLGARTGTSPPPPPRPAVEFRVPPPPPKAAPQPEPVEPPKPSAPKTSAPAKVAATPAPPPPPDTPPPPPAAADAPPPPSAVDDAPLDLTGNTLTTDHGAFTTRTGNGRTMGGPVGAGAPPPPRAPPAPSASASTTGGGNALTPKEDLSRLPEPPDLASRLLAHYPEKARATGASGRATLSLVIGADGRVAGVEVRSASSPEFGRACEETLRGTRWVPPLDKAARPTATRVGYTCYFDVR